MHTRKPERRMLPSPVESTADPEPISLRNVRIKLCTLATLAVAGAMSGAAAPVTLVLAVTSVAVPFAVAGHGGAQQVRALFLIRRQPLHRNTTRKDQPA